MILPVFRKASTYYAIDFDGNFRPIIYRSRLGGFYRHSKKPLPDGLPPGKYLGNAIKVDEAQIEWRGIAEFVTEKGMTRLNSEIKFPE